MTISQKIKPIAPVIFLYLLTGQAQSEPFEECPSEAFLSQYINGATHYKAVDLATGSITTLQTDDGLNSNNINGLAFNETDRYVYGFNMSKRSLVRFDNQFAATTLSFTNPPANTFFVADIHNNNYYFYRKSVGFFYTSLDPANPDYLRIKKIEGADQNMNIADFAFHPADGNIYAVSNRNGDIYQIKPDSGQSTIVANAGYTAKGSAFGAAYFDASGYLYFVRNNDGNIYRSDLTNPANITGNTVYFAKASPTSSNDGARCANAPVVASYTDFGDAPDSYGTTLASNGARHRINYHNYYLGNSVDAEGDAVIYPDSDEDQSISDEDGIIFKTGLVTGLDSLINVTVGGGAFGYLHAWFDWNRDGDFDDIDEHVINGTMLNPGEHDLLYRIPQTATPGKSWARFRFSDTPSLSSNGGHVYGEVEDYQIEINAGNNSYLYYPGENSFVTLAYEDMWPEIGDYDFNDVVILYRVTQVIQDGKVNMLDITGRLAAYGASYANGFAVQLEGIKREWVDEDLIKLTYNGQIMQNATPLESDQENAVVLITNNLKNHFNSNCGGRFYRTEAGCNNPDTFSFEISIPLQSPVAIELMPEMPLDPFIYAVENRERNPFFENQRPGRSLEIHLADHSPTERADANLFGQQDDRSLPPDSLFRTEQNLPWAIEIGSPWLPPLERTDISVAYPDFIDYMSSGGTDKPNWFNYPVLDKTYH